MNLEFRGEMGSELTTLAYILKPSRACYAGVVGMADEVDTVLACLLL